MKLLITLLFLLSFIKPTWAQDTTKQERVLYVVDSIPIIDDPEEGTGTLSQDDIDHIEVVTDKAKINRFGYENFDKIIYITTKEYSKRTPEIKSIPTTKLMIEKNGVYYLRNSETPYSGQFINYFPNGKKQDEGTLINGKVNGLLVNYQPNGYKAEIGYFIDNVKDGAFESYHVNGRLEQKGTYKNDKEDGLWQEWYSTGILKRQNEFKDGKQVLTKDEKKFYGYLNKGIELSHTDHEGAIKQFDKAIELNNGYADAYFRRGTEKLMTGKYEEAIVDYDKTITIEPLYPNAIGSRGIARLWKYELGNSRVLKDSKEVTILATKNKFEIPNDEQEKMCSDLKLAVQLGFSQKTITDTIEKYCK